MANQIRMTPDTMRQRAHQYTDQANQLQQIISTMDRLLTQLQSEWEGDASRAYAQKFNELRPGFTKAKELIDQISTALKDSARIVEETDRSIANQLKR